MGKDTLQDPICCYPLESAIGQYKVWLKDCDSKCCGREQVSTEGSSFYFDMLLGYMLFLGVQI